VLTSVLTIFTLLSGMLFLSNSIHSFALAVVLVIVNLGLICTFIFLILVHIFQVPMEAFFNRLRGQPPTLGPKETEFQIEMVDDGLEPKPNNN
jgi:hypothetical protein